MATTAPSLPAAATGSSTPWPASTIDAVSHGAIAFAQIYYEALDEPSRRATDVPQLYLPGAKIIWNGTPIAPTSDALRAWIEAMPISRHDLQTLDCHPIPAPDPASPTPDILATITGSVLHGPAVALAPTGEPTPDESPRKFVEVFVLRAAAGREGMQPMYGIQSANFRFIG